MHKNKEHFLFALALVLAAWSAYAAPIPATADGQLGLYPANNFRIADGTCSDCKTIPQAMWYFNGEALAVPAKNTAGFFPAKQTQADVASWAAEKPDLAAQPPLVWLGSNTVIQQATLSADGKTIVLDDGTLLGFGIVPKIPTNLSYWDNSTSQYFASRPLRLRGEIHGNTYTARTVWPLDYSIAPVSLSAPLLKGESLKSLVQYENGGARSSYQTRLLWERNPGAAQKSPGKAVVGLMLNGAQGDDDEAHGGHFGVVTGRFEVDGNWSRWLVNNFYNLDSFSEKGIVAAVTPMDKYLMDLNNGQSYYRPSYMVVATFRNDAPAALYQGAINRVYNHFYRHDFVYDHSRDNCSGISIDTFRTLGWNVPERGVENHLKATAAYMYVGATEGSLDKGRKIYDYLTTETTRLYPAVTFDAMGNDLLALAQGNTGRDLTPFEQKLAQDIEAIWFVRIPQVPSSRAFGLAPVYSFDQYMSQAPEDRSQWKIVPTEPRPFPANLRNGLALAQEKPLPVPIHIAGIGLGICLTVVGIRRRSAKRKKSAN